MAKSSVKTDILLTDVINKTLQKKVKRVDFLQDKTLLKIGKQIIDRIVTRTESGYGATKSGKSVRFKAYDPKYLAYKKKAGKYTGRVNLIFTGEMLGGLHVGNYNTNRGSIEIRVDSDDEGKARGAHEGIKRKKGGKVVRPFLGLTKTDKKKLAPKITSLVKKDFDDLIGNEIKKNTK